MQLGQFCWDDWISEHRGTLRAIGLPTDVYISLDHWLDFIENGHLHWHPDEDTGFSFDHLNDPQQRHLLRFIESQIGNDPFQHHMRTRLDKGISESFPLVDYLRHRHPAS